MGCFPTHKLLCSGVSVTSRLLPERARRADSCLWTGIPYASAQGGCEQMPGSRGTAELFLAVVPHDARHVFPSPQPARGQPLPVMWPQPKGCVGWQDGAQHPWLGWDPHSSLWGRTKVTLARCPLPSPHSREQQQWSHAHWGSCGRVLWTQHPGTWPRAAGQQSSGQGNSTQSALVLHSFQAQQFVLSSQLCHGLQRVPWLLWGDTLKLCFSGKHKADWHLLREIPVYSANTLMPTQKHSFLTQEKAYLL